MLSSGCCTCRANAASHDSYATAVEVAHKAISPTQLFEINSSSYLIYIMTKQEMRGVNCLNLLICWSRRVRNFRKNVKALVTDLQQRDVPLLKGTFEAHQLWKHWALHAFILFSRTGKDTDFFNRAIERVNALTDNVNIRLTCQN